MGNQEGGILGDPYSETSIENGRLHVSDYGGSSQRWEHDYAFGYHEKQFILTDIIKTDFDTHEGLYTRHDYDLLEKELEIFEWVESSYENNLIECVYIGEININWNIAFHDAYACLEAELIIEN